MKDTLNMIFDFQNIAMRALFTSAFMGGTVSNFDTDEECEILVRKIAMDMAYTMRTFTPNKVIIVTDAKHPWRNELYDPLSDDSYKGTRVKDDTKNWDKIYKSFDELIEIFKNYGFIVSSIAHAEADDLAALWKKQIFDNDENVILVSSDKDWLQLVDFNPTSKNYCLCFNPIVYTKGQKKLYCTEDFLFWLNNSENKTSIFFDNFNSNKDNLKKIQTKDAKITYSIIKPESVVLEKILCGDDGDNVPSFYHFFKNGKRQRITPSKSKKIFENLNINTVSDLCQANSANALKPEIEKVLKKELDDVDVDERLIRQRRMVELNPILFPEDIIKSFYYHVQDCDGKGKINTSSIKLEMILKDTKFVKEGYNKPKENSVFDDIKGLEKYIKPLF